MASNALECEVCCNDFSEDNCPRILPCSHTFCGPCINRIIAAQSKICPTCREEFTATSAEDLMICRIVLDVVKQLSTINVKPKTLSEEPTESFHGFTKKLTKDSIADFLEAETQRLEEMKNVTADIKILSEMRASVINTNKGIEGSMERLQEIKLSNDKTLDILDQKIKWLKNRMSLILQDTDVKLETATDFTSIGPVMDETEEVTQEGQERVKRNKEFLENKRHYIINEILGMKRRLESVSEDIQKLIEADYLVISAVKTIGGKQMVAPVRVEPGNPVRLSHFAEGNVPPKSLIIEHEALMNGSSRRAFLDLAVGGTFLARIVIKVMDEGHLALHFLHACAGDLGQSYANSQISEVRYRGQDGEHIYMSGYGGCGTSLLSLDWGKEGQREIYKDTPLKAGAVRGFFSDETASCFWIVTTDNPNWANNTCFGKVEEGLDALRDAISRYPDITCVRIVDCGLMFPL